VVRTSEHGAGAVDLGNGYCAVFSLATALGSDAGQTVTACASDALRDVLASGTRPVALLDAVKLGSHQSPAAAEGLRSLAARLGAYVKDANVPVVGGNLNFDAYCSDGALAQVVAIGVTRTERLMDDRATGLGNTIICAGAARDARSESQDAPSDAFAQRRLSAGCLAAFDSGSVAGALAVSSSGIAGAAVRLAEHGATGIDLDVDAIPRLVAGVTPLSALCTPGGEQMLLVVRKGREEAVVSLLGQHDVKAHVVGRVTNTARLVCKAAPAEGAGKAGSEAKQTVVADLPIVLLTRDSPSYEPPLKAAEVDPSIPEITLRRNEDEESELVRLLSSPNVGSREWLIKRLEQATRGGSQGTKSSLGDAAVLSVPCDDERGQTKLIALAIDGHPRHAALDPRQGAAMAVAECARNLACVGAEPLGLAHGLSFGSPGEPDTAWRLSEAVDGLHDACLALKLPVVAGHVTLAAGPLPATPTIAVVGQLQKPEDRLGMAFGRQADMVALLGALGQGNLAGAEYLLSRTPEPRGKAPVIDLAAEVKLQRAVLELARERLLSSAHDVSDGGLGVALAECCIEGRIGCSIELPASKDMSVLQLLFHEEPSRVVVSFPPEQRAQVEERCQALGVPFSLLGFVGGDTLEIEDVMDVPVQVLADSYSRALERLFQD
jgi:phosphoribosylformylglycinamidine synthase